MIDTELTVAYINGRIQERQNSGQDRSEAVLNTLAVVDLDLYVRVLKDGAHADRNDLFTDYLRRYYK